MLIITIIITIIIAIIMITIIITMIQIIILKTIILKQLLFFVIRLTPSIIYGVRRCTTPHSLHVFGHMV